MTMNSRDDRSELRKILDDSIKFDWEVEIETTQPEPAPKAVVGWREGCALQRHRTAPIFDERTSRQ